MICEQEVLVSRLYGNQRRRYRTEVLGRVNLRSSDKRNATLRQTVANFQIPHCRADTEMRGFSKHNSQYEEYMRELATAEAANSSDEADCPGGATFSLRPIREPSLERVVAEQSWLVRAPGPAIAWLVAVGVDTTVGDPSLAGRYNGDEAARIVVSCNQKLGPGWHAEPYPIMQR